MGIIDKIIEQPISVSEVEEGKVKGSAFFGRNKEP